MNKHIKKFNESLINNPKQVELELFLPIHQKIKKIEDSSKREKMIECYNTMWEFYSENFIQ